MYFGDKPTSNSMPSEPTGEQAELDFDATMPVIDFHDRRIQDSTPTPAKRLR